MDRCDVTVRKNTQWILYEGSGGVTLRLLQQITVTPASGNHSIAIVTIVLIQGMRKCHVTAITAIHVYHAD